MPVCLDGRRVGTLYVEPAGPDTSFRAACTGLPAGLYRLYACGADGQLLLGIPRPPLRCRARTHRRTVST